MRKPTFCICENKGKDQLRSYCEADLRLCFCFMDSTIDLLSKSKISRLYPSSVLNVQLSLFGPVQRPQCWFSHVVAHRSFAKYGEKYKI